MTRRNLPTGTVTFVFTDIQGSTRMLQELGDRYTEVLLEHRAALRDAWRRNNGVEVGTEGDSFFVAFAKATDAVNAAREAQEALKNGPVKVRIGVHTGEPSVVADDYVGIDVHRAARISSAAHGGQIVISARTRSLLADDERDVVDLGLHRLKDLAEPERLFQVGLGDFPPLRSLNATNLPVQATPLIGRVGELEEIQRLLDGWRVVTLTGPGGTGKTRLAIQAGAESVERFKDGTFWVPLASITDPALVLSTIAGTLGAEQLDEHIGAKQMLILLDNIEQVLGCAGEIARLLSRCPNLRMIVTSRAPMRIESEREYRVEPLPEHDAITLFRERAVARDMPDEVVAAICRRLDGLPLALELAAARTRIFSAAQLLERLEQRLPMLTGGRRDAPARHRALRATIEWSHDLLEEQAQLLFARLAVFSGGFDLDAAEAIVGGHIDALESLVEESLVRHREDRFSMLETIREYALERLGADPFEGELRSAHARFYLARAEAAAPAIWGTDAGEAIERLTVDEDNLRSALSWFIEDGAAEEALRFCIALTDFWEMRSELEEALRWFEQATELPGEIDPPLRALALREYGGISHFANRYEQSIGLLEESVALWRSIDDDAGLAGSLRALGATLSSGDLPASRGVLGEALEICRRRGDRAGERRVYHLLGEVARDMGDLDEGAELLGRSIEIAGEIGASIAAGASMHSLADLELDRGDVERAESLYRDTLKNAVEHRLDRHKVYCLAGLAASAARRGERERALTLWRAFERAEHDQSFRLLDIERARYERALEGIGGDAGQALGLDEAVAFALES